MTNYQSVVEFNKTFGVPVFDKPQFDIFTSNPKLVELRMSLIREELAELEQAVKDRNMPEVVDALSDLIYVVQGMGASLGLNLDKAFDIVHKSNMSKCCKDEEEAKMTVEYYMNNKDRLGYDTPAYRLSDDGKYFVVYNQSTGKILKSINYTPAEWSYLNEKHTV
jgi:predicted HAD superfamily Cof-like phosphohydrolase